MIGLDPLDLLARAEDEADALVHAGRHDVENALAAGAGAAAGLLDQERDRIGLVEQPQPAGLGRVLVVARIEEHAATHQDAVRFGDQRRDPAHVEILAARPAGAGQAFVDVALHRRLPEPAVRRVDREFLAACGCTAIVRMRQEELAEFRVEREAMRRRCRP